MLKNFVTEFRTFLLKGNAIDVAIGIVFGAAFGAVVDAIVKGLFTPIIGVLIGGFNFSTLTIPLYKEAHLSIGMVIQNTIAFVIVGFCLFLVVKAMNKLKAKEPEKPAELTTDQKILAEIRDLLKARS